MSLVKSLSAVTALGLAATAANAGISAAWVERTGPAQPAGARTFSLVVSLTGSSLFNVAGFKLDQTDLPGMEVVQVDTILGPNDFKPTAGLITLTPAVEFDTYVTNTDGTNPSIPGKYIGTGAAELRSTTAFNVAWGATPNTGPAGGANLEIARISLRNVLNGFTPVQGEVRSSDDPNTAVPLPPIPVAIPEPATLGLAAIGLGLVSLRRR
jgi:hypothetical protein